MSVEGVFGQAKVVSSKEEIHASFLKTCVNCGFPGGVGEKSDTCVKCQSVSEEKQMVSA